MQEYLLYDQHRERLILFSPSALCTVHEKGQWQTHSYRVSYPWFGRVALQINSGSIRYDLRGGPKVYLDDSKKVFLLKIVRQRQTSMTRRRQGCLDLEGSSSPSSVYKICLAPHTIRVWKRGMSAPEIYDRKDEDGLVFLDHHHKRNVLLFQNDHLIWTVPETGGYLRVAVAPSLGMTQ